LFGAVWFSSQSCRRLISFGTVYVVTVVLRSTLLMTFVRYYSNVNYQGNAKLLSLIIVKLLQTACIGSIACSLSQYIIAVV
jgi:hypothetical protein